jgi:hypothetical protein
MKETPVTVERQAQLLCRINAIINWTLAPRGIVSPAAMAAAFGGMPPNYPFVIRLWSAFVFMFGCMFWETGRDVRAKAALLKYNWIEKSITALAVTLGYVAGEAPPRLMLLIVLTNWLWIPAIVYYDFALRRTIRAEESVR